MRATRDYGHVPAGHGATVSNVVGKSSYIAARAVVASLGLVILYLVALRSRQVVALEPISSIQDSCWQQGLLLCVGLACVAPHRLSPTGALFHLKLAVLMVGGLGAVCVGFDLLRYDDAVLPYGLTMPLGAYLSVTAWLMPVTLVVRRRHAATAAQLAVAPDAAHTYVQPSSSAVAPRR